MKMFFYDLETTGVKHWRNGIHQISGMIEIDGEVKERFNIHVAPNPSAEIDDKALEVGGVTLEQIQAYQPMSEAYKQIIAMLSKYVDRYDKKDKFFLVGYNNRGFDDQFFRAFFVQNNDNYFGSWFWADTHDVMVMASVALAPVRTKLVDFKLKTVAAAFGIEISEENLHDAQYDIEITRTIYHKINELNYKIHTLP